ncbi:cache domain-containing protein [Patescibacteria group bacterium]
MSTFALNISIFWQEYLHFLAAIIAILVSISAAFLFFLVSRREKQLRTVWRPFGFLALAIAFFLFILERKYPGFALAAIIIEVIGFFAIFRGVLAEPVLSQLRQVLPGSKSDVSVTRNFFRDVKKMFLGFGKTFKTAGATSKSFGVLLLLLILLVPLYLFFGPSILLTGLEFIAFVFLTSTIYLQIKRYRGQRGEEAAVRRLNLWPLIAYIFLFFRQIAVMFYRLPEYDIVTFRRFTFEFGLPWQLAVLFTILGFVFLFLWAWTFIKVRPRLRTYVVFLAIAVAVSSLGALIFTLLVFGIVEKNNLQLMEQGARTEKLIMEERSDVALLLSQTIAKEPDLVTSLTEALKNGTESELRTVNTDSIRIYDSTGKIIKSPYEPRDIGRDFSPDPLVKLVLDEGRVVKSFGNVQGVLSPVMTTRAFFPLISGSKVTGAVEVGYSFDNAFVDFSKEQTGLDVTMYTGAVRSATTIKTLDGVSRWAGSEETNKNVIETVLVQGERYSTITDRLGIRYYSAYEPVRDVNGAIIGMVSVGVPTQVLLEDSRQQLLTAFLIAIGVSLAAAVVGYYGLRRF